ncbi:MAG: dissimilatory-type sulfite reductase subunit alpha [Spirochaetia bacterium]|nr:dissimilatory-type sulfite reductase subunit alpha [Spirochaetia bacterium]
MSDKFLNETPMLDQLETKGWPSFISGFKKLAERTKNPMLRGVMDQLEYSYKTKMGYWKGGTVGVVGYGAGIISRFSMIADKFPEAAEFHTVRVQPAPGLHYSTKSLRELMDIWEKYGCGIISMHGQTGNLQFQGITQDKVQPFFDEINKLGWDLGGAGACMRTGSSCVGQARCENACYDTLHMHEKVLTHFTDYVHRPEFPYKIKMKFSGCANDCVNSIQRSDMSFIGTWKDSIQVDQNEVKNFINADHKGPNNKTLKGSDVIRDEVINMCPTNCMSMNGDNLEIDNANCVRCMHCINVMPKALSVGKEKGLSFLLGGKGHLKVGNMLGSMVVPFMKAENDADIDKIIELIQKIIDWWSEAALDHERIGETIERIGMVSFLDAMGLEANPEMVNSPRDNPYFKAAY